MGWALGLVGGAAERVSQTIDDERKQNWAEEQTMISTMMPIAMENRKQRQIKRKQHKEQYSVLTSIVSPQIAQGIMRKGDLFTQNFMTKVGEMENSLGRSVTEADLIKSGDVQARRMEYFPKGMRTVETLSSLPLEGGEAQTQRVRTAPVPIGYRELGTNEEIGEDFNTFMREIMGDFKSDPDIDTNKLRDDLILNFGKSANSAKAIANSAYRKIAAQMGIPTNEVTSFATGEYDYTDVPLSRNELYSRDVRMPFVKGQAFYDTQAAELGYKQLKRANNLRHEVIINGVKELVTTEEAIAILGYEEAALEFARESARRVTTSDQDTALTPTNVARATKIAGEWVADALGGKYIFDPINNEGVYSFSAGPDAARKRELAYKVTQQLDMVYNNTVLANDIGTFVEYKDLAGLNDPVQLRMFILNEAHKMDPDTNTYVRLLTESTKDFLPPPTSKFFQGPNGWPTVRDKPAFKKALAAINKKGGFGVKEIAVTEGTSEGTPEDTWNTLSYGKYVTFTEDYKLADIGDKDTRATIATEFNDTLIDDIKQFKGITESTYDDRIREYLDISNILANKKLSLYSIEEGGESKLSKIEAKVDGLDEFIEGLMPTDTKPDTKPDTAEADKAAAAKRKAEAVKTIPVTLNNGSKAKWDGPVNNEGKPTGQGVFTMLDKDGTEGNAYQGNVNSDSEPTGPYTVILPNGEQGNPQYFPPSDKEKKETGAYFKIVEELIGGTRYDLVNHPNSEANKELDNFMNSLKTTHTKYEAGEISKEVYIGDLKRLGQYTINIAEPLFKNELGSVFSIGSSNHKKFIAAKGSFNNLEF